MRLPLQLALLPQALKKAAAQVDSPAGYRPPHNPWATAMGYEMYRPAAPPVARPWPETRPLPPAQQWLPDESFNPRSQDIERPNALDRWEYLRWREQEDRTRALYDEGLPTAWDRDHRLIGYAEEPLETLLARYAAARGEGFSEIDSAGNDSFHDFAMWLIARPTPQEGPGPVSDMLARIHDFRRIADQDRAYRAQQARWFEQANAPSED